MDLNKAMIIGNITQDPEVRTTPQGTNVTSFSIATNLVWTDQSGIKQSKVEYHNIVAWRKLAEICGQYLKKGKKVYIEGRLQTRDWQDQNGTKRFRTEIVADNMIMLDRGGATGGESSTFTSNKESADTPEPSFMESMSPTASSDGFNIPTRGTMTEDEIKVENIPF